MRIVRHLDSSFGPCVLTFLVQLSQEEEKDSSTEVTWGECPLRR